MKVRVRKNEAVKVVKGWRDLSKKGQEGAEQNKQGLRGMWVGWRELYYKWSISEMNWQSEKELDLHTHTHTLEFEIESSSALSLNRRLHPTRAIPEHFWISSRSPLPRKEKHEIDQVKAVAWAKLISCHCTRGSIYPMWFCCCDLGQSLCFTLRILYEACVTFGIMHSLGLKARGCELNESRLI